MKPGTTTHEKMEMFMDLAKISRPTAVGTLELLWHYCAASAPDGGIGRVPNRTIERAVEWRLGRVCVVSVLTQARWLDKHEGHVRLYVHDWHEHCNEATHMKLYRAVKPFANGSYPSPKRIGGRELEDLKLRWTGFELSRNVRTDVHTPVRTPVHTGARSVSPLLSSPLLSSPLDESSKEDEVVLLFDNLSKKLNRSLDQREKNKILELIAGMKIKMFMIGSTPANPIQVIQAGIDAMTPEVRVPVEWLRTAIARARASGTLPGIPEPGRSPGNGLTDDSGPDSHAQMLRDATESLKAAHDRGLLNQKESKS